MKRILLALCITLLSTTLVGHAFAREDLTKHWAYSSLTYAIEHDILKGDTNGNMNPDKSITRAEFAAILVRSLHLAEMTPSIEAVQFSDVTESAWYASDVKLASQFQLIFGDDKGQFNPNDLIARQDMASMLRRTMDLKGIESYPLILTFKDKNSIANYAYENVQRVVSMGIMTGVPGNLFNPKANATRAEAATVLVTLLTLPADKEPIKTGREITYVNYATDYSTVLTKQTNSSPKVEGAGNFNATSAFINYYLHPNVVSKDSPEFYQYLRLDKSMENLKPELLDTTILKGMGVLADMGSVFIEAGQTNNVNEIYLVSHALHETGKGTSTLAKGIEVGLNASGVATMVTDANRSTLTNIKKVYNMFGIQALDSNPNKLGSEYAYKQGWFTVNDAIIGGAAFIGNGYIHNGQNTLYKMKWNPAKPATHQYATHVQWAVIQARTIAELYKSSGADQTTLVELEVPVYANQPTTIPKLPAQTAWYAENTKDAGKTGFIKVSNTSIYTYPVAGTSNKVSTLSLNTPFTVVAQSGSITVWYKVKLANGTIGWVNSAYVTFETTPITPPTPTDPSTDPVTDPSNPVVGKTGVTTTNDLNFRSGPATTYTSLKKLANNTAFTIIEVQNGWYKVNVNGEIGWISASYTKLN